MKTKPNDKQYCGVNRNKIKAADPILSEPNMAHFLTFIQQRYLIHIRKDIKKLPQPWTNNHILDKYRFTNVRREHDYQTRMLIQHITSNSRLTLEEKIVNVFMFRAWNNVETFLDFGFPMSEEKVYNPMTKERYRKHYYKLAKQNPERKWWSSAYNQGGTKAAWKFPAGDGYQRAYKESDAAKHDDWEKDIPLRPFHIGPWLDAQNIVGQLINAADQQDAFEIIKTVRGFSDFLAYQVFVDLTYIEDFPFSENEFVVAGPGCKKGLDLVFKSYGGLSHAEAIFWLRDNFKEAAEELYYKGIIGILWNPETLFRDLSKEDRCMNVMSLENCLCEISKYIRAVEGTGGPRNRYKPSRRSCV